MNGSRHLAEPTEGRAALASTSPGVSTRTFQGLVVPQSGAYRLDPVHSTVEFEVRHLGLGTVRGRFDEFTGTLDVAEDPMKSRMDVTIDAASVDTREAARDEHLRSADLLDVGAFPRIEFHSTGVRHQGGHWLIDGHLTVRGVNRPITLEVQFEGSGRDLSGRVRIGGSARVELNREDFGLTWNRALENGRWLIGGQVRVEVSAEAVQMR